MGRFFVAAGFVSGGAGGCATCLACPTGGLWFVPLSLDGLARAAVNQEFFGKFMGR